MAKKGGNGINRLIGQQQQQNAMLQAQTQNTALALGGAQNIAMMTQNGLSALAIGAHNNQTLMAMSAQANLGKMSF
jgi:hypothetical protein